MAIFEFKKKKIKENIYQTLYTNKEESIIILDAKMRDARSYVIL